MVASRSILLPIGAAILGASSVLADQSTCSLDNKCPESAPCCSRKFVSLIIMASHFFDNAVAPPKFLACPRLFCFTACETYLH